MECPNCKEKYRFQDVPYEYRNMKFLVTEFICPFCEVWITPGKAFKGMLIVFILTALVSILFIVLGKIFNFEFIWIGLGLSFFSFICLFSSKVVLKYEIKNNISRKFKRTLKQRSKPLQNTFLLSNSVYKADKIARFSKDYKSEFIFLFLLYFSFSYFILGMTANKSLIFYISLVLFGTIYSFVCTEIYILKRYWFFAFQIVAIPLLIISIILNFHFLNLAT